MCRGVCARHLKPEYSTMTFLYMVLIVACIQVTNFLCVIFKSRSYLYISFLMVSMSHSTNTLETGSQSQPLHISKH